MQRDPSGEKPYGKLFIVATPIGNLEDLTFRALKILERVNHIACEDTRHSRKLLTKYNLKKRLISYFQPKERQKIPIIISLLKEGKDVALISDAGTPGISDPGYPLIKEAITQDIEVIPIPGVSALTTSLSAAGLPTHRVLFVGFPPPKREAMRKLLQSLEEEPGTLVFYLPTRKLSLFCQLIQEILGERPVVIARELTKIYEEFLRGTPEELIPLLEKKAIKGEATVLVGPEPKSRN
ncbi:16S rRNA (cytidine(1402)-2'-O)-methyltransferase [Acidobacteriota bacterium]